MSIIISGGKRLRGNVTVQGSKNAALPILAACLMTNSPVTLHRVPDIDDLSHMLSALTAFGCQITREDDTVTVDSTNRAFADIGTLAYDTRAVTLLMGSSLTAFGKCQVYSGGGCDLGSRPINYHIDVFTRLGARFCEDDILDGSDLCGCHIALSYPSVGATQNALLASVCAPGTTQIHGAAREPEICDLIKFLCSCGAHIIGMGTSDITIKGVSSLHGCEYSIMPDRCAAVTYLMASAITCGSITLENITPFMLYNVLPTVCNMGVRLSLRYDSVRADTEKLRGLGLLKTGPHPGFPTDMQPLLCAALTKAAASTTVYEQVFDNRFSYALQLNQMGAHTVSLGRRVLYIPGGESLHGAETAAQDLRGGAALVLAALGAEGTSKINNTHHISRGYENIVSVLTDMGADIKEGSIWQQRSKRKREEQKDGDAAPCFWA